MEYTKKFIDVLKELMQEKELTSKQLAKAIGIDVTSISKWFTFTKTVSLKHLVLLADYFGCSIDFLIGRSEVLSPFTPQSLIPFSQNIRKILAEKGFTRYSFVKQTRFSDAQIYQWDKGTVPKLPMLIELADLFDCSIDYLVGREI